MLFLRLFGGASLESGGERVSGAAVQRHRVALLALLASVPSGTMSRERLMALLWPESDHAEARHLLNVAVHALRKALHEDALRSVGRDLSVNAEYLACDVTEFLDAMSRGAYEEAVALRTGPFLDGFFLDDAQGFERWQDGERSRLDALYMDALERLATAAEGRGQPALAVGFWRQLVRHDEGNVRALLHLMEALEVVGERAEALELAESHRVLMASEYGAEPDPEVVRLAARLRNQPRPVLVSAPLNESEATRPANSAPVPAVGAGDASHGRSRRPLQATVAALVVAVVAVILARSLPSPQTRAASVAEASVAVLPFVDSSSTRDRQFLSDGLTEELMGRLARVQGLRVAARTSSFLFRGREREVREIGKQLGVAAVVVGSVREEGDQLHIVTMLFDTSTGAQLWSNSYNVAAAQIFSAQDAIARSVASTLNVKLRLGTIAPLGATAAVDPRAHELAMRGRFAWNQRTDESVRAALRDFEEAARIDPRYAVAFAGISDAWQILPQYGHVSPRVALANSKTAALRALALDSTLAEAHTSLAAMLVEYDRDRPAAEREYQRAIALNPGYATARHWYALYLAADGRIPEAVAEIERGRRLDPLSSIINSAAGVVRYFARDYDGAIAEFRAVLSLQPDFATAWSLLGRTQCAQGAFDEAIQSLEKAVTLSAGAPAYKTLLAHSLAAAGRTSEAESLLRSLATDSTRFVPAIDLAAAYVILKRVDDAFRVLERGYDSRDIEMKYLKVDPRFDDVRGDPRFARLLAQLGLSS